MSEADYAATMPGEITVTGDQPTVTTATYSTQLGPAPAEQPQPEQPHTGQLVCYQYQTRPSILKLQNSSNIILKTGPEDTFMRGRVTQYYERHQATDTNNNEYICYTPLLP